jgi:hypothetical protein
MDEEADQYKSDHEELVNQQVWHQDETLFQGDKRRPLSRIHPLPNYPLDAGTPPLRSVSPQATVDAMTPAENLKILRRDELLALGAILQRQAAELTAVKEALRAAIARLTPDAKLQAAPFAKGSRVSQPKRLGRKPGSAPFHYREAPIPGQSAEPSVNVPVLLAACPACGGRRAEERIVFEYTADSPASPRPQVTQYRRSVCRGLICGKQVRGQHPHGAPDQYGATAHRAGDRAMAAAHALPYGLRIPVCKVPLVLAARQGDYPDTGSHHAGRPAACDGRDR